MTPWLDDGDVQLHHGDVIQTLRSLPAGIAQTCVTSPPYWGLRDYGTGEWSGGAGDCDHVAPAKGGPHTASTLGPKRDGLGPDNAAWADSKRNHQYGSECGRCGARRVDSQLGLEATPDLYVERMVAVFREVWRVLRPDATVWLNLGDSYAGSWGNQGRKPERGEQRPINGEMLTPVLDGRYPDKGSNTGAVPDGLKPKDLVGIPWRVAFALQTDGWYLRSDIVWSKPNPMPESVTDRPTKAHEYLFLLAKRPRYYMDMDAIREPHTLGHTQRRLTKEHPDRGDSRRFTWQSDEQYLNPAGRNRRSVWTIPTEPFPEAHFATYPQALVRPCILAGTSEHGECSSCGAPWQRQTEAEYVKHRPSGSKEPRTYRAPDGNWNTFGDNLRKTVNTVGWEPSCECGSGPSCLLSECDEGCHKGPCRKVRPVPQTVLDPFIGSGTTALVARNHGRRCIGIDLSAEYLQIAARRLQQLSLLGDPA